MASLSKILNKGRRFLAGAGLASVLSLSGCSVMENMSDAEWISALGSAAMVAGGTEQEIIAGAVAKTIGDNQVQKEAAREGKTEVNVYGNGQAQYTPVPSFDYSSIPKQFRILPDIFVCNYWDDKNGNGLPEFDEITGLKTEFYSNEPVMIVTTFNAIKGGAMLIDARRKGGEKIVDEGWEAKEDGKFCFEYYFPLTSLKSGNYSVETTYYPKWWSFSSEEKTSEFKIR